MKKTSESSKNKQLPVISVIVPSYPNSKYPESIRAAQKQDYPSDKIQILHVQGRNASKQRNEAIQAANGEIVYFLDEDSVAPPDNLRKIASLFNDPSVILVGGPNVAPSDDTLVGQSIDVIWTSYFGILNKKSRYKPTGPIRLAKDHELIGCNLAICRNAIEKAGFFDCSLFPNEENDLIERIRQILPEKQLWYDPKLIVVRERPAHFSEYVKKLFCYGRGRSMQFRKRKSPTSIYHWVVLMLMLAMIILTITLPGGIIALVVLAASYLAVSLVTSIIGGLKKRHPVVAVYCLALFPLTHLSYTMGMIVGLFRKQPSINDCNVPIKTTAVPVKREHK